MKRKNALIAAFSAFCVLTSCQSSPKEAVYSRPMEEFGRGKLTVAYANYGNTNNYFGFTFNSTEAKDDVTLVIRVANP